MTTHAVKATYRNLIPALADSFHVIAPDYPGFGNSDMPDPATFAYTFDKISVVVEAFLRQKGFDRYGLYAQDYGGPVGFRIVGRHPEALEWLVIQNTNAYDVGFTAAWDSLRGAIWKNRTPETEKPLDWLFRIRRDQEFLPTRRSTGRADQPGQLELGLRFDGETTSPSGPARPLLRLPYRRGAIPAVAAVPPRAATEDDHFLGPG